MQRNRHRTIQTWQYDRDLRGLASPDKEHRRPYRLAWLDPPLIPR